MLFVLHFLRPGDLFVDVGANVGAYTILASAVCGTRSLSFEPVASSFAALTDNIRLNAVEHLVAARQLAIGAARGHLTLTTNLDAMNHALSEPGPGAEVEVATLDEACAGSEPVLLKIDTEGYEPFVLDGAHAVLGAPTLRAVLVELCGLSARYGRTDLEVDQALRSTGFVTCSYDPVGRVLVQTPKAPRSNALCVRQVNQVLERIRAAPSCSLPWRRLP